MRNVYLHDQQGVCAHPILCVGADGVLYVVARVAPGTDLYALGRAMIETGFGGVREVATHGVIRFWKVRCDTEGLMAQLRAALWSREVRV